ncbi:MAG: hypothetical protein WCP45_06405 [Verrucomicrobiota bacterium]
MKLPLAVAVVILVVGASLIGFDYQRLVAVRASHAQLVAEAATLGIAIDPSHPAEPVRIAKHERENREQGPALTAAEFIAFALEMEASEQKNGGRTSDEMQQRVTEFIDRLMALSPVQLKALIAEVRNDKELKSETRQNFIGFSIMTLANDHPQTALALFTESSDLFKDGKMGGQVVASSLARWAKIDPMAALAWIRKNSATYAELITEDTKRGMIFGAAVQYPKLAFKLLGELDLKDPDNAVQGIVGAARTAEERTTALAGLRLYLATLNDGKAISDTANKAVFVLARGVAQDGFAAGSQWLTTANLTPAELEAFAEGLNGAISNDDTGPWIEWLGSSLPLAQATAKIRGFVGNWAQNDCQAAGKWLGTLPDGFTKNTSVRAYAESVSRYDPEVAAQWALTLPAGKDRNETLISIYQNWPSNDAAGAAAFAKQYGIR